MMVTSCDELTASGGSVLPTLTKLKNKAIPLDERVHLYSSLAEEFQKDDISSLLHDLGQQGSALVSRFCQDIQSDRKDLNQASLRILGLCLHYEEIAKSFTDSNSSAILTDLCSTILKTEDKSTCTRALWCLSRQQLPGSVIQKELHNILCATEHVLQKNKFQSMTSEYEAVNLLIRLLEQLPDVMSCHTTRWAPLLFPLTVHSAHKIREKAHQAIQLAMPSLRKHQAELAPSLVSSLKSTMLVDMAELFSNKQERYVLQMWKLCVELLEKALHKGGSLINLMLRIVEQGFKHGYPEIKRDSFEAWKVLIDNFTLDLDVLSNAKRLKLLMQPFLATSTKQESVALAKFDAWWYLCTALGPRLSSNFEVVVVPLLQFSLGLTKPTGYPSAASTPSGSHRHQMQSIHSGGYKALVMSSPATTPRMNLSSPSMSSDPYNSLVLRGIIVLCKMLTNQDVSVSDDRLHCKISNSLPALSIPVLSKVAMAFIKITSSLIPIVCDTVQEHGKLMEDEMCIEMFSALTQHVKNVLENSKKQDNAEMFGSFLHHLQTLINEVDMEPTSLVKFMSSLKCLPVKVLSSSAYLSGSVGCVLHGTPTLFLLELLLGPKLVKSSTEERYFILLEYLIECGVSNQSSVLGFTNSYLVLLDKVSADLSNKEIVWRMWSALATPLLEHVLQTNEVNQGDSFEHDFSALIACLLFPVQKILPFAFPLQTTKALLKTWTDLYQAFSRCAAMVTTAEDNQCCQDLCTKICSFVIDGHLTMNLAFMEVVFHLCKVMVDSVDYSSYTNQNTGMQSPITTVKWNKRKHKPLRNLSSLVKLLSHVIIAFHKHRSDETTSFLGKSDQTYLASWTSIVTNCCHTITALFSHISRMSLLQQLIGKLAKPLSGFYGNNNGFPTTDVYKNNLLPKLDKLWQEVLMAVQSRYPGPYDSEALEFFEPILEATLTTPHRSIRNHTLLFWNATFAKATSLNYSDGMRICLQRVKEKSDMTLPDWTDIDITEDESCLPVSETGSQSHLLPSSMSPSPRKIHGSFLQRPAEARQLFVSSSPFKSPAKPAAQLVSNKPSPAKAKIPARRKLNIEEESTQDFVFISPSPKKKQILTEHQKEIRQSKRVIPALYNDLEQSQDTQAFSELTSTESQLPERSSLSIADVTKETTTLTDAFAALKRSEGTSDEDVPNSKIPSSDSVEVVGKKKVKFADNVQEKEKQPIEDRSTDDFVAKMNEKIKSLKSTIRTSQKEPSQMSVTVVGETQIDGQEEKVEERAESNQSVLNIVESIEEKTDPVTTANGEQIIEKYDDLDEGINAEEVENADIIPETQFDQEMPLTAELSEITMKDPLEATPEMTSDLTGVATTESLETSQTTPTGNSFPFQVADDLDLSDVTCCDNKVSPDIKISTPLIKVHKLDLSKLETEPKGETDYLTKAGQNTPVITLSPTGSQTPNETPRFRRYKSEEIQSRSLRSGGKVRKWHSFEDPSGDSPETESFSPMEVDVRALLVSPLPFFDPISDKADLDGIQPLDCSFDAEDSEKAVLTQEPPTILEENSERVDKEKNKTPLRRGKRQRKRKEFSDYVTPKKLLSVLHQSEGQMTVDGKVSGDGETSETGSEENAEEKKRPVDEDKMQLEEKEKNEDDERETQTDREREEMKECEPEQDEEPVSKVWEPTQELFSMDAAEDMEVSERGLGDEEREGLSKVQGGESESQEAVEEINDRPESEKEVDIEKEERGLGKGNEVEAVEEVEPDVSKETPLADEKKGRKMLGRRGRKKKNQVTEVIDLCDTQSQETGGNAEGDLTSDQGVEDKGNEGQRSEDLADGEMKEQPVTDKAEMKKQDLGNSGKKKSNQGLRNKKKRGREPKQEAGRIEKEMNVEDGENNTSRSVKEVVDEKEVESLPKNQNDSVNCKEEMVAEEISSDSEDDIPLTHLRKNAVDDNTEQEIISKEASIDSESQSRCQESLAAVQTQVSTSRSVDRNSQKESNSRRRRRLNRSVSPKIRRNLCEKFLKAKQVSPKSTSFHGYITRRRSPKRSPKLLRSKGLLGPIHTRLRSKAGHLKRISPKQRKSMRRKNASQSKSVTSVVATLNDSFDDLVKLSYDGEPMDNVTLESELEEAKSIDADCSLTREDCNAVTIQGKDVVVTTETNSSQEHVPTSNSTTTSEAAIQDSGSSVELFQSDSAEDSEENEKTAEVNAEPESLPIVSEQNIPKVVDIPKVIENVIENTGLTNEEDCSEEIIHSSYSPTSLKSNVDDLDSGSQGSTRHAGMQQYLTGKDTDAAKLQPASPVIPVKFAPVIHSSPVATAKVTSSSHGSPEVLGIPGVYSPTASPSGGILKKREDGGSNSPSPTNKNRRVKFSEKVSTKEIENCTPSRSEKRRHSSDSSSSSRISSKLMPSPLVTTTPSRVLNVHSKYITTTPSKAADDNIVKTTGSSRHLVGRKSRSPRPKHASKFHHRLQSHNATPPTQGNSCSQLDSSLDEEDSESQESVFPKLQDCQAPVEEILPQLTSSMWSRGLGQLVRARNIFTIGQLSTLTPSEVQSLPIRSPKVSHLKWVLGQYLQRLQSKNQTDNTTDKGSKEAENKPSTSAGKEDGESSSLSLKRKRHDDDTAPESSVTKKVKLVEQLEKLSNGLSDELRSVSPNELFKAHEHINAMMDAIMNVLKTKYQPSSKPS